jgi:ribosomal protein S27AE
MAMELFITKNKMRSNCGKSRFRMAMELFITKNKMRSNCGKSRFRMAMGMDFEKSIYNVGNNRGESQ